MIRRKARRHPEHRLARRRPDDGGARPLLREQGRDQGADARRWRRRWRATASACSAWRRACSRTASGRNLPEHRLADYLKHCALGRLGTSRRGRPLRRVPRLRRQQLHDRRDGRHRWWAVMAPAAPVLHRVRRFGSGGPRSLPDAGRARRARRLHVLDQSTRTGSTPSAESST